MTKRKAGTREKKEKILLNVPLDLFNRLADLIPKGKWTEFIVQALREKLDREHPPER